MQSDQAWIAIIVAFLLAALLPVAGPRLGQSSAAQWRATHRASARWRRIGAAAAALGGVVALLVLVVADAPVQSRWIALAGAVLAMLCVIPAVRDAGRALTATRRAEDAERLHRPLPHRPPSDGPL